MSISLKKQKVLARNALTLSGSQEDAGEFMQLLLMMMGIPKQPISTFTQKIVRQSITNSREILSEKEDLQDLQGASLFLPQGMLKFQTVNKVTVLNPTTIKKNHLPLFYKDRDYKIDPTAKDANELKKNGYRVKACVQNINKVNQNL